MEKIERMKYDSEVDSGFTMRPIEAPSGEIFRMNGSFTDQEVNIMIRQAKIAAVTEFAESIRNEFNEPSTDTLLNTFVAGIK